MLNVLRLSFLGAVFTGTVAFAVGFFGPLMWAPDANQGPLLGIFITGPLGFLAGAVGGAVVALRKAARPKEGTGAAQAADFGDAGEEVGSVSSSFFFPENGLTRLLHLPGPG